MCTTIFYFIHCTDGNCAPWLCAYSYIFLTLELVCLYLCLCLCLCLQAITYKDEYYKSYCQCSDFIRRHIFPGGHLPSMGTMLEICNTTTSLSCYHVQDIGLDYATTLKLWHENWCAKEKEIKALGHDDVFFRKWRFYFSYCEAGFEQGFIHNYQIVWAKSPVPPPSVAALQAAPNNPGQATNFMLMTWCFLSGIAAGKYLEVTPETLKPSNPLQNRDI